MLGTRVLPSFFFFTKLGAPLFYPFTLHVFFASTFHTEFCFPFVWPGSSYLIFFVYDLEIYIG